MQARHLPSLPEDGLAQRCVLLPEHTARRHRHRHRAGRRPSRPRERLGSAMTEPQRAALRRLRGVRSLQTFADHLRVNGLPAKLSRQRLSQVEQGDAELPPALWHAIADVLIRGGQDPAEVAALRPAQPAIDPPPETTPALRVRQWTRVVNRLAGNRWWQRPNSLMERVAGMDRAHSYRNLAQQHDIDMEWQRTETSRRLALTGPFATEIGDDVCLAGKSMLDVVVAQVELFVLRAVLH